jgi:hypothetical protein
MGQYGVHIPVSLRDVLGIVAPKSRFGQLLSAEVAESEARGAQARGAGAQSQAQANATNALIESHKALLGAQSDTMRLAMEFMPIEKQGEFLSRLAAAGLNIAQARNLSELTPGQVNKLNKESGLIEAQTGETTEKATTERETRQPRIKQITQDTATGKAQQQHIEEATRLQQFDTLAKVAGAMIPMGSDMMSPAYKATQTMLARAVQTLMSGQAAPGQGPGEMNETSPEALKAFNDAVGRYFGHGGAGGPGGAPGVAPPGGAPQGAPRNYSLESERPQPPTVSGISAPPAVSPMGQFSSSIVQQLLKPILSNAFSTQTPPPPRNPVAPAPWQPSSAPSQRPRKPAREAPPQATIPQVPPPLASQPTNVIDALTLSNQYKGMDLRPIYGPEDLDILEKERRKRLRPEWWRGFNPTVR